jgi:DNA-binding ferritin-like protein (Dps family)
VSLNKEYADNLVKAINEQIYEDKKDWKAWAKRIMANPKNYPAISLEFAKEALRVN